METNRVKQFVTLVHAKNLRKAAESMNISHGAFHKSMQVLQSEVGLNLYTVDGRNIVITPAGMVFFEKAKTLLEAERNLFRDEPEPDLTLSVGTHETFATYLLAAKWGKAFPNVNFICREMLPGRLEEAVAQGLIEVGLTFDHVGRTGIEAVNLGRVKMGIYATKDLSRRLPYPDLPFVAPVMPLDTTPSVAKGLDGWPEGIVSRRVSYRVDLLSSALTLVGGGDCAIFIPHFVAHAFNSSRKKECHIFPIRPPRHLKSIYRNVHLIHRVGWKEKKILIPFARMIKKELTCT